MAKATEKSKTAPKKQVSKPAATKNATKKATLKSSNTGKIAPKKDAAEDLKDFLLDGLEDLYWAEKALTKNLPKMMKNATSPKLKDAIAKHLKETENQITRLEQAFKEMGEKAKAVKCDAMDGLLKEAKSIMEETEPGAVRDAAIIAAAQKVEHYEIASYGTMATYAELLGLKKVKDLLGETLNEEKTCDKDLTKLAKSEINIKAK